MKEKVSSNNHTLFETDDTGRGYRPEDTAERRDYYIGRDDWKILQKRKYWKRPYWKRPYWKRPYWKRRPEETILEEETTGRDDR